MHNKRKRNFFGFTHDIQGMILLSKEGLPIFSALIREVGDSLVSAVIATILNVSEYAVKELNRGRLKRILIQGVKGSIILSKVGSEVIMCTLVRNDARLGLVFLDIQNLNHKLLSGKFDDEDDEDGYFSFPYIFKPPTSPRDLGLTGELQAKRPTTEENLQYEPYCKHCGAVLPKGQSICHVCGKKVI